MQTALNIVQIVVSIALIVAVLFQVRGGGIGGIFGQADSVFRTKRGIERWLFLGTIVLVVIFVALSIVTMLTSWCIAIDFAVNPKKYPVLATIFKTALALIPKQYKR